MREFTGEIQVPVHICKIKCENCGKVLRLVDAEVISCKCGKAYHACVDVVTYDKEGVGNCTRNG
jgi:hypothetical protein